jgi:hypothetical protein
MICSKQFTDLSLRGCRRKLMADTTFSNKDQQLLEGNKRDSETLQFVVNRPKTNKLIVCANAASMWSS